MAILLRNRAPTRPTVTLRVTLISLLTIPTIIALPCRVTVGLPFQGFMKWPRQVFTSPFASSFSGEQNKTDKLFNRTQIYNLICAPNPLKGEEMAKTVMCYNYKTHDCVSIRSSASQSDLFAIPDAVCSTPSSIPECYEYLGMTPLEYSQEKDAIVFDLFSNAKTYRVTLVFGIFLFFLFFLRTLFSINP